MSRILVADDHPVVCRGLAAIIEAEPGMVVSGQAPDGLQGVKMFREHRPDVTLMDLRMPGRNGVDTIGAIRREYPHSRFIVLTTYDGDEDIYRALEAGAQAYLLKDMLFDEILTAIHEAAAHALLLPGELPAKSKSTAGKTLVEITDAERCCGSAGVYNLTHPEVSAELQRQKVASILAARPDVVVSGNPGCILQIAAGLRAVGSAVPVVHLARFLDDPAAF